MLKMMLELFTYTHISLCVPLPDLSIFIIIKRWFHHHMFSMACACVRVCIQCHDMANPPVGKREEKSHIFSLLSFIFMGTRDAQTSEKKSEPLITTIWIWDTLSMYDTSRASRGKRSWKNALRTLIPRKYNNNEIHADDSVSQSESSW